MSWKCLKVEQLKALSLKYGNFKLLLFCIAFCTLILSPQQLADTSLNVSHFTIDLKTRKPAEISAACSTPVLAAECLQRPIFLFESLSRLYSQVVSGICPFAPSI